MPYEMDKLTEQRRGSNAWALEELIDRGLGKLVADLKARELAGFGEDVCELVKDALRTLAARPSAAGAAFASGIVGEFDKFRQNYGDWNGQGTKSSKSAIIRRRQLVKTLHDWRAKMLDVLRKRRKGGLGQASLGDYTFVKEVYAKFRLLVDAHPLIFPGLKQSVERFEAAGRQTGR